MIKMRKKLLAILLLSVFTVEISYGQSLPSKKTLVEGNKSVSRRIDALANQIDTLLSNRKGYQKNNTTVRIIGFTEYREPGDFSQSGHVALDLRLPKFEDRLKLQLTSFDREDEFEGLGRNRDGAQPRENKFGSSVGLFKSIGKVKTLFRPRIEFRDPLVTSFLLKFNRDIPISDYILRLQKKFFTHSRDGVGQALSVDLDRAIFKTSIFRFFNEAQYLDRDNIFRVSQGPTIRTRLYDNMAISNTFSVNSANRELTSPQDPLTAPGTGFHLTDYQYILSFSHETWKRVFHYQISPYLRFNKRNNFKGQAGIILQTEIIF